MMSTARLKVLRRQEQNQRKFVCVMNDVAKTQQDRFDGFIEKEKQEVAQKCDKSIVCTRRNIVRQRVLKKCMKTKREEVEKKYANRIFGKYHGETVEEIAGQIDPYLEKNHPKIRRRQKIDELFNNGYDKGAILDNETIQDKVRSYFSRPLVHVSRKVSIEDLSDDISPPVGHSPPYMMSASKPFYTGNLHQERYETIDEVPEHEHKEQPEIEHEDKLFVSRKVNKFLNEEIPDNISVQSEVTNTVPMSTSNRAMRPLTLPPIKLGSDSVHPQYTRPIKQDCITQLIDRIHKAKDNREKEIRVKKEKRAKRLQAERVHGFGPLAHEDPNMDQINNDWDVYEAKKNELLSNIANTKKKIELKTDREKKRDALEKEGRLYMPPIRVTQKPVLLK